MKRLIIIIAMLFALSSCATMFALPVDMGGPRTMTETETEELAGAMVWDAFSIASWLIW